MIEKMDIRVQRVEKSRVGEVDFDSLGFGKEISDHMFVMDYADGEWKNPEIVPFDALHMHPSMSVFHYGQAVFEGLKAFRTEEGSALMFRPDQHEKRMNDSAARLCMPSLPEGVFTEAISKLIDIDRNWIPKREGDSLYLRPLMISTDLTLGVQPSDNYKFIILASPVGAYYSGKVKVLVEDQYVRAAEGGTGYIKAAGNYAASLLPAKKAIEKGYDQILWTDGKTQKYVEEIGTMNVMFQVGDTIITPKLTSSILPGITRKSVIELAHKWGQNIEERKVSVEEIVEAHRNGELLDVFGTGTAATITHISSIGYEGEDFTIGDDAPRIFSTKAQEYLSSLKVGRAEDYMNWMVKV